MEIKPPTDIEKERDERVLLMLIEAIKILGGPRKLIHLRNLTWIPSLLRACYMLLLKDAGYTNEEIAEKLGTTKATIQKMASADPEAVLKKIEGIETGEEVDEHVAGGIAKLAYKAMRRRLTEDEARLISETAKVLGADWAVKLMTSIKGLDFPVEKADLLPRLAGFKIYDIPIEEILDNIEYPIASPAKLVKEVAEYIHKKRGK